MDYDCAPPCGGGNMLQSFISDNILFVIIVLAVLFGLGYFVTKAAVKNGILEALKEPDCPLAPPCPSCGL